MFGIDEVGPIFNSNSWRRCSSAWCGSGGGVSSTSITSSISTDTSSATWGIEARSQGMSSSDPGRTLADRLWSSRRTNGFSQRGMEIGSRDQSSDLALDAEISVVGADWRRYLAVELPGSFA